MKNRHCDGGWGSSAREPHFDAAKRVPELCRRRKIRPLRDDGAKVQHAWQKTLTNCWTRATTSGRLSCAPHCCSVTKWLRAVCTVYVHTCLSTQSDEYGTSETVCMYVLYTVAVQLVWWAHGNRVAGQASRMSVPRREVHPRDQKQDRTHGTFAGPAMLDW